MGFGDLELNVTSCPFFWGIYLREWDLRVLQILEGIQGIQGIIGTRMER
jgi:hypothetical protein